MVAAPLYFEDRDEDRVMIVEAGGLVGAVVAVAVAAAAAVAAVAAAVGVDFARIAVFGCVLAVFAVTEVPEAVAALVMSYGPYIVEHIPTSCL